MLRASDRLYLSYFDCVLVLVSVVGIVGACVQEAHVVYLSLLLRQSLLSRRCVRMIVPACVIVFVRLCKF